MAKGNKFLKTILRDELILAVAFVLVVIFGSRISSNFLDIQYLLRSTTLYVELGIIAGNCQRAVGDQNGTKLSDYHHWDNVPV